MPNETCACLHDQEEHDQTDGLVLRRDASTDWQWVEASRCHLCPCMRYRPVTP